MKRVDRIAYIGLFIVIILIVFIGSVGNLFLSHITDYRENLDGFDLFISGGWQGFACICISFILLALMRLRSAFNAGLFGCGFIGLMLVIALDRVIAPNPEYEVGPGFVIYFVVWILFCCSYMVLFKYKDPGMVQKWFAEKRNLKIIRLLQFEIENRREITKSEMIGIFGYRSSKAEKILKDLIIPVVYRDDEIPELKEKAEEVIQTLNNPTIYDIMNHLKYDLKTTKKIRKYLIDENLVPVIPRVPIGQIEAIPQTQGLYSRKEGLKIFMSYSTLDSAYFNISKIVKDLEKYSNIERVFYWEVDSKENIVEFMDETLKKANVFILFCTNNSMNSNSVKNEWQAAFQRSNKGLMKIVPVYEDEDLIPPLLGHFLNVKYTKEDFKGFIEKLYQEIVR